MHSSLSPPRNPDATSRQTYRPSGPDTGFAFIVSSGKEVTRRGWGGAAVRDPVSIPVAEDTLFDLASLTKPLCTALLALLAAEKGVLDLRTPIPACSPGCTPLDLLRHTGRFPPWIPLYAQGIHPSEVLDWLTRECPRAPGPSMPVYSCMGYILLGLLLERRAGRSLDALFREWVLEEAGIDPTEALFAPPLRFKEKTAATELRGDHEAEMARQLHFKPLGTPKGGLWGVVHDGNARFMNGIAGNAGLFCTAEAAFRLARLYDPEAGFLSEDSLRLAWTERACGSGDCRTAGWRCAESAGWPSGAALGRGCIGHEGFTGTGVWLEPTHPATVHVLLTNRIHPVHPGTDYSGERAAFLNWSSERVHDR